ncbi:hypothetical protein HanPI659440_Chr03g0110271 [Helianthus annuus]|nr:hypothetical protein HanPI659440_Chr03g0110271 [Helianthus annuus]
MLVSGCGKLLKSLDLGFRRCLLHHKPPPSPPPSPSLTEQLFLNQSFSRTPKHVFFLFVCGFLFMMKLWYNFDPFNLNPCGTVPQKVSLSLIPNGVLKSLNKDEEKDEELKGFWKQPDGLGYRPCLDFNSEYKKQSVEILKDRTKYLVVFVSGDIFDAEHFKEALADDVRIISSLPSNHLMSRPVEEKHTPLHVSPQWIQARYLKRVINDISKAVID